MFKKLILLTGLPEPLVKQFSAALDQDYKILVQPVSSSKVTSNPLPDLILLGLESTEMDTLKYLKFWFKNPVLVLSGENKEKQIIEALNLGASDYIHIPVNMPETLARIRAALRDRRPANKPKIEFRNMSIDFLNRLVKRNGKFLKLSPLEYQLLLALVRSENKVVTSQYLVEKLWGEDEPDAIKDLRVHIMHLRKKIERDPGKPEIILTEPKIGYKFSTLSELPIKS